MYRSFFEFERWFLLAALLLVLGGCATSTTSKTVRGGEAGDDAVANAPRGKAARPARVKVEADVGFTVTEAISITGEVRADYQQALRLLAEDDYEGGIALLVKVTDKSPDATAPFVDLGIAYSRAGRYQLAESSFSDALASTPDHPVAHNELGIVYRKLGRFAAARQSYERALAIYPGFHYARRNLAVLCDLYLADLPCALEHYEIYRDAVLEDKEVDIWIGDIRNRISPIE